MKKEIKKNNILKKGATITGYVIAVLIGFMNRVFATTDPYGAINNVETFFFTFIRVIGVILLGWGIVQVGMALKGHDASQRANGFWALGGGILIVFAREIIQIILGE